MRKSRFAFYGVWIGLRNAVIGSFLFSLLAIPFAILMMRIREGASFTSFDLVIIKAGIIFASLYCIVFSILPGATGGAYLAHWLKHSERTPPEITRRGLLVGAAAGLVTVFAFMAIFYQFIMDWIILGFAVLAIAVAAVASLLAARWLAKKKSKFIQPQTETVTQPTD